MLFIRAYAESASGGNLRQRVDRQLGITGGSNPQSLFYRRTGTSGMGGNRRTRGRQATITPVRGR